MNIDNDFLMSLRNSMEEPEEENNKVDERKQKKKVSNSKHNQISRDKGYHNEYYEKNDRCYPESSIKLFLGATEIT